MQTKHLTYSEVTNHVAIEHEAGDIDLGPLDCCLDEVPSVLLGELKELVALVREAEEYGLACEATARHADESRHSPGGWR